jgi:hypothetical protein
VVEYSTNGGQSWSDAKALFTHNGYNATISSTEGNPLGGRDAFSGPSQGYISSRLNLGALAGQQVRFRFRIGTDALFDTYGWFIDDLRIYTCAATSPALAWKTQNQSVFESARSVTLQVGVSGVTDKLVRVPFSVSGTAQANQDYVLTSGVFTVTPGESTGSLIVRINDDQAQSGDRTLILTLGTPENATLSGAAARTITIKDNDSGLYIPLVGK